jgi:hypothetical protein
MRNAIGHAGALVLGYTAIIQAAIWVTRFMLLCACFCGFPRNASAQFQQWSVAGLEDEQVLELKGDWDYFWGTLIEPGDARSALVKFPTARVWKSESGSGFKDGQGYASYRLLLTDLPPHADGYSLAIRSASAATKLMIYPKDKPHKIRMGTAGRVGLNAQEEIPQLRPVTLRFFPEPDEREWVVLVHVSNFHYGRGGLWTAPLLSTGNQAAGRIIADRELILFCLGMITVIGVYNIVLFIRRPSDKPTLMLAIFCTVVCLRSAASDNLISWYFPALDARIYRMKYLVEYATMVLGPLSCISFLHLTFPASSLPRFYRFVVNLTLLAGLLIVILDTYYCSLILTQFQVVVVAQICFGMIVVFRALVHRREEALMSTIGSFILSSCVVYDILVTFNIFSQPYLTSLGMSAFVFMQSQVVAQRFAKAFRVAEYLSLKLKDEVERQTLELRSIMENIPQGVFIMLADQTMQGNYSRELEQLLDDKALAGRPVLPALFRNARLTREDLSIIDSVLVSIFHEPDFVWDLNASNLPHEFIRQEGDGSEQIFAVEWHPVVNRHGLVDRVLVTLRNVTELRGLQAAQRKDQEAFALLLEIVQVSPDRFRDFIKQSHEILRQIELDATEAELSLRRRKILMRLHTWKGLARSLQFKSLAARIHDLELVMDRAGVPESVDLDMELESIVKKLRAYENVGKERLGRMNEQAVAMMPPEVKQLLQAWYRYHDRADTMQRQILDEALSAYVKSLPDITLGQLLDTLDHELTSLASDLKKPVPSLDRQGVLDQPLPGSLFRSLGYALQHLVRNSMDHGLESPAERQAKGKDPRGRIRIRFTVEHGMLIMDYSDDGRGLDLNRVLKKAEELQLLSSHTPIKPQDIAQFIFAPGFSTKGEADMISGRGIGMDAVRLLVEESGGTIALVLDEEGRTQQGFHLRACWSLSTLMNEVA